MASEQLIDGLTRNQAVIWAAGFIDGEGSIGLKPSHHGKQASLLVQATQVDPVPLLRLRTLWGGALRARKAVTENRADYYQWFVWSGAALLCCQELLPYLASKRAQAQLGIEYQALKKVGAKPGKAGELQTQTYREAFKALNRRGVPRNGNIPVPVVSKSRSPQLSLLEAV